MKIGAFLFSLLALGCSSLPEIQKEWKVMDYSHSVESLEVNPQKDIIVFRPVGIDIKPILVIKDGRFFNGDEVDWSKVAFPLRVFAITREGEIPQGVLEKDGTLVERQHMIDLDLLRSRFAYSRSREKDSCVVELAHQKIFQQEARSKKSVIRRNTCIFDTDLHVEGCSKDAIFRPKHPSSQAFIYVNRPVVFERISKDSQSVAITSVTMACGDCPSFTSSEVGSSFKTDLNENGYEETWISDLHDFQLQIWENFDGKARILLYQESGEERISKYRSLIEAAECACERRDSRGKCVPAW